MTRNEIFAALSMPDGSWMAGVVALLLTAVAVFWFFETVWFCWLLFCGWRVHEPENVDDTYLTRDFDAEESSKETRV